MNIRLRSQVKENTLDCGYFDKNISFGVGCFTKPKSPPFMLYLISCFDTRTNINCEFDELHEYIFWNSSNHKEYESKWYFV
jgi:hypothetical protein